MTKSYYSDGELIIAADPFRCRLWHLHDRSERYLTVETCREEIESIRRGGQLVPAIGRYLGAGREAEIEIVCGARRLFIARYLNIPLRVQIREMTDQEAAAAMQSENRLRREVSPYERGMCLAKLLDQKVFKTQEEMAKVLNLNSVQVSRLLKFADLPEVLLEAFPCPRDILESWVIKLHKAWQDKRRSRTLTARARTLIQRGSAISASEVYRTLIASPGSRSPVSRIARDPVIMAPTGRRLLRVVHKRSELAVTIPNDLVTPALETEVMRAISAIVLRHIEAGQAKSRQAEEARRQEETHSIEVGAMR